MNTQFDHMKVEYDMDYNMNIVVAHRGEYVPTICMGDVYPDDSNMTSFNQNDVNFRKQTNIEGNK